MNIEELKIQFIESLQNDINISKNTVKSYTSHISNTDFNNLHENLRFYRANRKPKSYNLRLVALNRFAKFLKSKEIEIDFIKDIEKYDKIKFTNEEHHLPYSIEQIVILKDKLTGWKRMAVLIALYLGLRQDEIRQINIDDFDFEKKKLHVIGKGEKKRSLPVPGALMEELLIWKKRRELKMKKEKLYFKNWLFTSTGTRPVFKTGSLATSISKKVGFHFKWHSCRATFATTLAKTTMKDKILQELMGHSSIDTTMNYVSFFSEEVQHEVERLGDFYDVMT